MKHIQRRNELYSPEFSMIEKGPKQQSVDIRPTPFQDYDPINYQIENTGNSLVALQPKSRLHSIAYPVSYPNSSTPFNLLILLRQYS